LNQGIIFPFKGLCVAAKNPLEFCLEIAKYQGKGISVDPKGILDGAKNFNYDQFSLYTVRTDSIPIYD